MNENHLIELDYLDEMGDKVVEVLTPLLNGNAYEVAGSEPYPRSLFETVANVAIDVAVQNTAIRAFHVAPLIEGDIYMVDIQDKNENSVVTVMLNTSREGNQIKVDDILATFKQGAIVQCHEELSAQISEETADVL